MPDRSMRVRVRAMRLFQKSWTHPFSRIEMHFRAKVCSREGSLKFPEIALRIYARNRKNILPYLVDVEVIDDGVKTGVQVIEQIHNLKNRARIA